MTPLTILGWAATAWVTVNLVLALRRGTLKEDYQVLECLKGWKWLPALLGAWAVLVVIVTVGLVLVALWPQVLGFSWLQLIATPAEKPGAARNLIASGLQIPVFAWVFLGLLAVNVPRLALNEEYVFRKGHYHFWPIVWQSLKFGLAHCIVGVPLGIGLSLGLAGGWFAYQYRIGGVLRSGAYHALHNWTLLLLAGLYLGGAFGPV